MLGWVFVAATVAAAVVKGWGTAALIAVAGLGLQTVSYLQWRKRIDAIGGPEASILGGNGKAVGPERLQKTLSTVQNHPKAFRMWTGPFKPIVFVCHPDTIKPFLMSKSTFKSAMIPKLFKHIGNSIFVQNGAEWKHCRRQYTPAFHFNSLTDYLAQSAEIADDFVAGWSETLAANNGVVEVMNQAANLTANILLKSVFSYDAKTTDDWGARFIRAANLCDEMITLRVGNPVHLLSPNWIYAQTENGKRFFEGKAALDSLCRGMIEDRRAVIKEEGPNYFTDKARRGETLDFLDIILNTTNLDGSPTSEEIIIGQCNTFIAAGFGTTTTAIGFTLYCLAQNKEWQNKCAEEAKQLMSESTLDLASLKKLKYISMCFKEANRLYPPVPGIMRDLQEDTEINGVMMEAGTTVLVSILGCHRNPAVWEDPEEFRPERFETESDHDPFAFIIYSAGPRNCIGQKYADMQSRLLLAKLLASYEFSIAEGITNVTLYPKLILQAENGIHLRVTRRET